MLFSNLKLLEADHIVSWFHYAVLQKPTGFDARNTTSIGQDLDHLGPGTHLGTVLLLAPLCAVPLGEPLWSGVQSVLDQLTPEDSRLTYDAIRYAQPGGLGDVGLDAAVAPELLVRLPDARHVVGVALLDAGHALETPAKQVNI